MSLWILDTDRISLFQQRYPLITQHINAVNPEEIAVTLITVEQQLRGRLNVIRRASSIDKLVSAYARLRATLEFFKLPKAIVCAILAQGAALRSRPMAETELNAIAPFKPID